MIDGAELVLPSWARRGATLRATQCDVRIGRISLSNGFFPRQTRRLVVKTPALWSLAATVALSGSLLAQTSAPRASGTNKTVPAPSSPATTGAPTTAAPQNPNQVLADAVARRLQQHPAIRQANIAVIAQDGTVTLSGTVSDAQVKAQLLAEVRQVAGVHVVRDGLQVVADVKLAQNTQPPAAPPAPAPLVEPAPLGMPGHVHPELQAPPLPPFAWPTYAPYPNFSRVAYPTAYPYNAFPFIGPFYPFPKVPLGWRKVTLEWEDGHWYYGRNSTPHDYWRVRFW